jgi:peptidoglycan hydrolase-like protein with peptidoglycan-binding domain
MPRILFLFLFVLAVANDPAQAARNARPTITPQAVNDAHWSGTESDRWGPVLLKAQVLLDRAGFSPGAIDARDGANFDKALRAFQRVHELKPTGKLDGATWDQLVHTSDEPVLREYTTMAADVAGPFVKTIPKDFQKMARLDRLAYRSSRQLLGEKFHLSEQLLAALNKGKHFERAGTMIADAFDEARKYWAKPATGQGSISVGNISRAASPNSGRARIIRPLRHGTDIARRTGGLGARGRMGHTIIAASRRRSNRAPRAGLLRATRLSCAPRISRPARLQMFLRRQ